MQIKLHEKKNGKTIYNKWKIRTKVLQKKISPSLNRTFSSENILAILRVLYNRNQIKSKDSADMKFAALYTSLSGLIMLIMCKVNMSKTKNRDAHSKIFQ